MYVYNGKYHEVNEKGEIEVTPGVKNFSKKWLIIGAMEYDNFGNPKKYYSFEELKVADIEWFYKNGKQKVFIRDLDHGTTREWRSPRHYFIK